MPHLYRWSWQSHLTIVGNNPFNVHILTNMAYWVDYSQCEGYLIQPEKKCYVYQLKPTTNNISGRYIYTGLVKNQCLVLWPKHITSVCKEILVIQLEVLLRRKSLKETNRRSLRTFSLFIICLLCNVYRIAWGKWSKPSDRNMYATRICISDYVLCLRNFTTKKLEPLSKQYKRTNSIKQIFNFSSLQCSWTSNKPNI